MNCELPDACGNDTREENLISKQQPRNAYDGRNWFQRFIERERMLLIAIAVMVVFMNFNYGRYILYPFRLFATWIHEMCHGMGALLVRGGIQKLQIFKDGSGLAYTWTSGQKWKRGFVASAGYPGTALVGGILLLFRRTTLGPTIGMITMGVLVLLSCAIYVRNQFGLIVLTIEGVVLVLCGWFLRAEITDFLYAFLCATCSFNAVESISDLFAPGQSWVGGEQRYSDAHTAAEYLGGTYWMHALIWLILALIMSAIGLLCARDARPVSSGGLTSNYRTSAPASSSPPHWAQVM